MLCTKIVLNVKPKPKQQFAYTTCSADILSLQFLWTMNNLSSYCGSVDAKIKASGKDLPVQGDIFIEKKMIFWLVLDSWHLAILNRETSYYWKKPKITLRFPLWLQFWLNFSGIDFSSFLGLFSYIPSITDGVHGNENFVEIIPVFSTFSNFFKTKKKKLQKPFYVTFQCGC